MPTERGSHHQFVKIRLASLCLSPLIALLTGCLFGLPRPSVRASKLADPLLIQRLCPSEQNTTRFKVRDDAALSGIAVCRASGLTVVLFNSFDVRVRTITASSTGELSDEVTYLCPLTNSPEEILTLVATASESPTHETSGNGIAVRIEGARNPFSSR